MELSIGNAESQSQLQKRKGNAGLPEITSHLAARKCRGRDRGVPEGQPQQLTQKPLHIRHRVQGNEGFWGAHLAPGDMSLKKVVVLVVQGAQGKDAAKRTWGPESGQRLWLEGVAGFYGEVLGISCPCVSCGLVTWSFHISSGNLFRDLNTRLCRPSLPFPSLGPLFRTATERNDLCVTVSLDRGLLWGDMGPGTQ